jgi:hypothetical protein
MTINIPTFLIPRPYEINPNWEFGFENIPSGNPVGRWYKKCGVFLLLAGHSFAIVTQHTPLNMRLDSRRRGALSAHARPVDRVAVGGRVAG